MQASTNTLMTKGYPKTEFIKNYFTIEINRLTEDIIEMIENQNVFSKKKYYDSKLENLYNDFYVFLLKQDLAEQVVLKDTSCKSKFNNDIFAQKHIG